MKKLLYLLSATAILFTACKDDDSDHDHEHGEDTEYDYHAHIMSPSDADTKALGDTLHIHVDFESHAGEPVHNVNVRIYSKADNTEVYSAPIGEEQHVHAMSGMHTFEADVILSEADGFAAATDYVLEAKVWPHEGEEGEVMSSLEFSIQ